MDEGAHVGEQLPLGAVLLRFGSEKHHAMREEVVLRRVRDKGHASRNLHLALASPPLAIEHNKPRRRRGGVEYRFEHFAGRKRQGHDRPELLLLWARIRHWKKQRLA
jgi:hypothetical protein